MCLWGVPSEITGDTEVWHAHLGVQTATAAGLSSTHRPVSWVAKQLLTLQSCC